MSKAIQSFSRGVTVSLAIHSRIYGGQFRSRVPLAWQRAMKVTTCWSTSFTSRRSSSKFRRDSSRGRHANPDRFECDFAKRVRDFGSLSETARWRNWGERRGLNPRPSVPQTDALPAELRSPPGKNHITALRAAVGCVRQGKERFLAPLGMTTEMCGLRFAGEGNRGEALSAHRTLPQMSARLISPSAVGR